MTTSSEVAASLAWPKHPASALALARRAHAPQGLNRRGAVRLRLAELQSELEPHFLFNALNSICGLVRGGDRGEALSALVQVSGLVRHALKARTQEWASVQEELAFANEYLALQRLRFGHRFRVSWNLANAPWHSMACPSLVFQPLIENAFKHCLEVSQRQELLSLELRVNRQTVTLVVRNDLCMAAGASTPATSGTRQDLPLDKGLEKGLGLAATRERLALLYGRRASLDAQAVGGQFVAVVKFPVQALHESLARTDH